VPEVPRPHPIKAVLADRRIRLTDLSLKVGCNAHTLGRVFNGYETPWPALRQRVARELSLPEAALFRDKAT
jgi:hypothetical protein